MAKKNIISDFGSLKGKISFSEDAAVLPYTKGVSDTKANEEVKAMESGKTDEGLKVGQSVVMMDSDHRGRIVSLGKTVGIELEDGFIIQAAYGEFAVTRSVEIKAMKQSKVKAKKGHAPVRQTTTGASSGVLTVDLHIEALPGGRNVPKGQQLQFQMDTFKRVIKENLSHRGMKINFIHGVGDGILRSAIRQELDEVLALRCTYTIGDPAVTLVTIR